MVLLQEASWEAAWISIEVFIRNEHWMEAHCVEVLNEHLCHVQDAEEAMENVFDDLENPASRELP